MLKDQDIICFSSVDWDFIWQGHQEIMQTLAKNGNRVLFVENTGVRRVTLPDIPRVLKRLSNWRRGIGGIRQEDKNLYVYSPLVFPFPYSRLARRINSFILTRSLRRWMISLNVSEPIAWIFLPTGTVLSVLKKISFKLLVYYCIDDFSRSSKLARGIVRTERELLKKSDIVFVTSQPLYHKSVQYNRNVFSFPFGVNIDNFNFEKMKSAPKPPEIGNLKTPIIGYIGGIHCWIDQQLVKEVARKCPDASFVFIGPIQTDIKELEGEKNVFFLGQKPKETLPAFVHHFAACLIPYKIVPYTENVYPTKLNEYLAIGKPVVSTPLPEILNFNRLNQFVVEVAKDSEEFSGKLDKILKNGEDSPEKVEKRIGAAVKNTWMAKIEQMSSCIEEVLKKKLEQQQIHWRENLLVLYRAARRNTIRIVAIFAAFYLVVFETPLVWWLGEPLRRTDPLVQSDLIAVLGAGVGESGLAGEGYQERVKEGVKQYQSGYGGRILFSSGYVYSFQEVEIMRALAVDLGVPRDKILIEKRPATTYDHLVYLKETLQTHGFDSVMIISSPYHMKRVAKVSQKVLSGYQICLVSVEKTRFFGDRSRVKLSHIKAIFHEYLALVYYACKGYI